MEFKQTKVYIAFVMFGDNEKMVEKLSKLEQSGQKIELSGNQSDKFTIDCDSIKIK